MTERPPSVPKENPSFIVRGNIVDFPGLDIDSEDEKLAGIESNFLVISSLSIEDRSVLIDALSHMQAKGFDALNMYLYAADRINETKRHEAKKQRADTNELGRGTFDLLMNREAERLSEFFGFTVDVPPVPNEITPARLEAWEMLGFELHYLPPIDMTKVRSFPGWKKKPNDWFYGQIEKGNISKDATMLPGCWVLIDGRQKPAFTDGSQMYETDPLKDPVGGALGMLRALGYIGEVGAIPDPHSRFGITARELDNSEVLDMMARALKVSPSQLRAAYAIDFNVIGNIHHPEWGDTNTPEWFQDSYKAGQGRLHGGGSMDGGLSNVDWHDVDHRIVSVAFRPSVRFF